MPLKTKAEMGQWNMECYSCGGYFKKREMKLQWNNIWACFRCFEEYPVLLFWKDPPTRDPMPVDPVQGAPSEVPDEDWVTMRWNGEEWIAKEEH